MCSAYSSLICTMTNDSFNGGSEANTLGIVLFKSVFSTDQMEHYFSHT